MMTITHATFSYGMLAELPGFGKEAYVQCTMYDIMHQYWVCEFKNMTLKQISDFIFEFFSAHSIEASQVKFNFAGAEIVVSKSSQHNSATYLDIISQQMHIG